MIKVKRAFEPATKRDGVRILVDRLWPRGVSKDEANIDIWLKEVAPSDELRKWFDHDPQRWEEFRERYQDELSGVLPVLQKFIEYTEQDHGTVTLVFAAKDEGRNNAVALREMLERQ